MVKESEGMSTSQEERLEEWSEEGVGDVNFKGSQPDPTSGNIPFVNQEHLKEVAY